MKRGILPFLGIAILFAGMGSYFAINNANQAANQEQAVTALFARTLPDAEGNPQSLAKWKGRTLVVNFWATWCAPCVEEIPELSSLQGQLTANQVQILGIGIDSPSNIREFASKHKVAYPLFVAGMGGSDLSQQFGDQAGALPFTVLINPEGKVLKTYLGRLKIEQLRQDLALH